MKNRIIKMPTPLLVYFTNNMNYRIVRRSRKRKRARGDENLNESGAGGIGPVIEA
jgi:uncharacterized membrane protein